MFVAERFVAGLVKTHGKHAVSTDGGNLVSAKHEIPETKAPYPFIFKKSLIERTMQYIKDRLLEKYGEHPVSLQMRKWHLKPCQLAETILNYHNMHSNA